MMPHITGPLAGAFQPEPAAGCQVEQVAAYPSYPGAGQQANDGR